jgi:hypothetical protein
MVSETVLMKKHYRTEVGASFGLLGAIIAPLLKLWWMIVVYEEIFRFSNFGEGPFPSLHPTVIGGKSADSANGLALGSENKSLWLLATSSFRFFIPSKLLIRR